MTHILYMYYKIKLQKRKCKKTTRKNTFTVLYIFIGKKKNPHKSGAVQLKPMVYKGQLYLHVMVLFVFTLN